VAWRRGGGSGIVPRVHGDEEAKRDGRRPYVRAPVLTGAVAAALEAIRRHLAGRDIASGPVAEERDALLRSWPRSGAPAAAPVPQRLPACDHLAAALVRAATGPAGPVAEALRPLCDALRWSYGYPADARWPDLAHHVAFAQIVGRRGLLDDDSVHLGLTLMAPQTHYPLHAHPAIELYLVLAGEADWRVASEPFAPQAPGSLVLHTSGTGHAMRTGAEPLLALYFWRGDLDTAPVYVDEPVSP
jgi:hypothetical protein